MKREIFIGAVGIGADHPVSIQSMCNTATTDVEATLQQIGRLADAGCNIARVALPAQDAVAPFAEIVRRSRLPVVADIHFDAALAMAAIAHGAHGIRINPGNIGSKSRLKDILQAAGERGVPIRIGVNAGSLEKKYRHADGTRAEMMAASALEHVKFFEDCGFNLIKLSLKASDVRTTIAAYRAIDGLCDYPLHVGVTEAGTMLSGTVKSAIGIGSLLADGIGNTIRVSLTADPVAEVRVAKAILLALGLRPGIELVSCPTCARTSVDIIAKTAEFEAAIQDLKATRKITVAIMGCEVNGPGEAAHTDIGVAFSHARGYLFANGAMLDNVSSAEALPRLLQLLKEKINQQ